MLHELNFSIWIKQNLNITFVTYQSMKIGHKEKFGGYRLYNAFLIGLIMKHDRIGKIIHFQLSQNPGLIM